ncbi:MAG: hypothetical protein ABIM50_00210 [Novosphingobium sp.]
MADDPNQPESVGKQALTFALFLLKMTVFLAGLVAFGFAIYLLRRSMG